MTPHFRMARFGWFKGVFIPTFLTIIGVVYYLRLGHIVENLGLLLTIIAILLAESIVIATALSISGISKHVSGPGGVVPLISKTLGHNTAQGIGIPLLLAQVSSVAFYIFGFTEIWTALFPHHQSIIVSIVVLLFMFLLTYVDIRFAVKAQLFIAVVIFLSVISIFLGELPPVNNIQPIGGISAVSFWHMFGIFFPAVTGIMAGVGLSGQLRDSKKDIPRGIFMGIAVTGLMYIITAVLLAFHITPGLSIESDMLARIARIPELVYIAIFLATFSSGLVSLIAASRLLQVLSAHSFVPFSMFFKKRKKGEPRNAIVLISLIINILLIGGSLNSIASLLTILFLFTYTLLNIGYFIKYSKSLTAKVIALYGALSSVITMVFVDVLLSLGVVAVIGFVYIYRSRRN